MKDTVSKNLLFYKIDTNTYLPLPYAEEGIKAGFPSPAQDYMGEVIDLNKELIKNPATTFYAKVVGDSMKDEDIKNGDILIVDKSLELKNEDLAVCYIDGEFTLKRVLLESDRVWLVPSNPDYPKIEVTVKNEFIIWGIVTFTIKNNRRRR